MGAWPRYLGYTQTLPKHIIDRSKNDGAESPPMDARIESATEILLEVLGLGDSWGSERILSARPLRSRKERRQCPSMMRPEAQV